jgi:hypothetical protein
VPLRLSHWPCHEYSTRRPAWCIAQTDLTVVIIYVSCSFVLFLEQHRTVTVAGSVRVPFSAAGQCSHGRCQLALRVPGWERIYK